MAIADVIIKNSCIVVIGSSGKEIKQMAKFKKEVRTAAGSTFTVKDGNMLVTYDKNCKEQKRRSG